MKLYASRLKSFPDPRMALDGIVDLSDDLSVERLLEAYSFGIFPWPHEGLPTLWFSPEQRGVLDFADLHVPRSLLKEARRRSYKYTLNKAFADVISACAATPRADQAGTWINEGIVEAYLAFHHAGYAHSLEVWEEEELIGGVYGVYVAGVFCGESMFFKKTNASKLALFKLVEFLKGQGLTWIDIQMVTSVTKAFGGKYIGRQVFLQRLEKAKAGAKPINFR